MEQWKARAIRMHEEYLSVRYFEAGGDLSEARAREIVGHLSTFGAIHIKNTGFSDLDALSARLDALGFAQPFSLGGRTSAAWQTKWVEPGKIRRMDYYPPSLYLLPNNEVQYRHNGPLWVLFYCQTPPTVGGRTFLHSAKQLEAQLAATPVGEQLLAKIRQHGLTIETGFLDQNHPCKRENYFQSWQERFETEDPDVALERARSQKDEYDECWWRDTETPHPTLMTRIVRSGFQNHPFLADSFLRFPRIALDASAAQNGFRRFPLGNGEELSDEEKGLLRQAFLATREGIPWEMGDMIIFDNVRYAHSRESFSGKREVFVAMAGEVHEDTPLASPSPPHQPARYACIGKDVYFAIPAETLSPQERFSLRVFDARSALTQRACEAVRQQFDQYGALLLRNTGLCCEHASELPDDLLHWLGFGKEAQFPWGGFSSGRTTRKEISPTLRATDDYPPDLWLLPHNEVLYQRRMPARLLFFSASGFDPHQGGRTFVHSAERLETSLQQCGTPGQKLLDSLREHGFLIEMGFLDETHPEKAHNYFRSWQDRFATDDRDEALSRCLASTLQFDEAWWREEPLADGRICHTLMTRIHIPAFGRDAKTGKEYLLFPRIALDPPHLHNGYRRYPKGNGEALSPEEIDMLLEAFLVTREGLPYQQGDILLVDNLRYGHSREPFKGSRELGVAMAGEFFVGGKP